MYYSLPIKQNTQRKLLSSLDDRLFVNWTCVCIIHRFGLLHHSYAEDTQLYITIKKQDCFADIQFKSEHNVYWTERSG